MHDNQPSARAMADTKAVVAGIKLEDEFHVRDKFAPDALERHASDKVATAPPDVSTTAGAGAAVPHVIQSRGDCVGG